LNAVDIAILVVLAVLLAKGLWLGLIHELCALIGLGGGTFLAVRYHQALAHALGHWIKLSPEVLGITCSVLLFLVTLSVCGLLGIMLSRALKLIFLGGFNRILGGLFGLVQGLLLLALALYGLSLTDWLKAPRQDSRLAPPFVTLGEQIMTGGRQLLP
jgi:membrane protein required for colicin V production